MRLRVVGVREAALRGCGRGRGGEMGQSADSACGGVADRGNSSSRSSQRRARTSTNMSTTKSGTMPSTRHQRTSTKLDFMNQFEMSEEEMAELFSQHVADNINGLLDERDWIDAVNKLETWRDSQHDDAEAGVNECTGRDGDGDGDGATATAKGETGAGAKDGRVASSGSATGASKPSLPPHTDSMRH